MLKEWSLVAFTILGQMAVGVFWFFHLPFLVQGRVPSFGWRVTWLITLALIVLLAGLAAAVSFFHLRHPFRARFVLNNLRTSWLSREILFELAFMALVAVSAWLAWIRAPERGLVWTSLASAGLAGGLFLVSMTRLYMLPTLPAWRDVFTPLSFLLTTLVLGALFTDVVVRAVAGPGAFDLNLTGIALILVGAEILLAVFKAPWHGLRGVRPGPSLRPAGVPPRLLHGVRLAGLALGLVFIVLEIATGGNDIMNDPGATPALLLAFAFILAGEAAGRFHFYSLVPRPEAREIRILS